MLRLSHTPLARDTLLLKGRNVARRKVVASALTPSRSNASLEGSARPSKQSTVSLSSDDLATQLQAAAANVTAQTVDGSSSSTAKPSLSMRPITTYVNVLVAGGNQHVGKVPWHQVNEQNTHDNETRLVYSDPHAVFTEDPSPWATTMKPVVLPEACREMVYKFQDTPSQGASLNLITHLECLLDYVLKQQAADYKKLGGCRGLHKSVACGSLEHSPTVCIYELPPEGPSRMDLVIMSVLSRHVALLPVSNCIGASSDATAACQQLASKMLDSPGLFVNGLESIEIFRSEKAEELLSPGSPLLLQGESTGGVTMKSIVQLFMRDPVYDMLDNAWDKYNIFCEKYEQAGKDVSALLASELNIIEGLGLPLIKKYNADKYNADEAENLMLVIYDIAKERPQVDLGSKSHPVQFLWKSQVLLKNFSKRGFKLPGDEAVIERMWPFKH